MEDVKKFLKIVRVAEIQHNQDVRTAGDIEEPNMFRYSVVTF